MKLSSRLKRIETAIEDKGMADAGVRVIVARPGETTDEAFAREMGDAETFSGTTVLVTFCGPGEGPAPKPKKRTAPEIDQEIAAIKSELHAEGYTDADIAGMMAEVDDSKRPKKDDTLEPEPLRCDELTRMFR